MSATPNPIARLSEAIALAQSGQRDTARTLLIELTAEQPNMELAWMWLASVTDDSAERIAILRRVLALNPANDKARAALARLTGEDSTANTAPVVQEPLATVPETPPPPATSRSGVETALTVIALVIIVIVVVLVGINLLGGRLFAQPTATPTATATNTATIAPAVSFTPSITPGGPTLTPYVPNTLPPTWTPAPTDTPPPTFTPLPTDTELPSATASPTIAVPTLGPTATPTLTPTLAPLATIAQPTAGAPSILSTSSPPPATPASTQAV